MTRRLNLLSCFGALVLFAAPALAQQSLGLSKHDTNAPIQVSSDSFEADMNAKTGTYVGNVIIVQGDMKLKADRVRVNVTNGQPDHIFATGNVVLNAPSGNAQGDNGVYDVRPRLITLTGRVILTKQKNVMRGSKLTVNLVNGMAQLGAGPAGTGGGRVSALFSPPPQQSSSTQHPQSPKP
jgi:lipopolysaccharide export system protein LptA